MKKVVIIGCGDESKIVTEIIELNGDAVIGYLDDYTDCAERIGKLSDWKDVHKKRDCLFAVAIMNTFVRSMLVNEIPKELLYTAVHPTAIISKKAKLSEGCIIHAGVVIEPFTQCGECCIINTGTVISHGCHLEECVNVYGNSVLCGNVRIGRCTEAGPSAVICANVKITSNTTVGASSTVLKDIKEEGVYYGTPTRFIKERCKL